MAGFDLYEVTGGMTPDEVGDSIRSGRTAKSIAEIEAFTGMVDGDTSYLSASGRSGTFIWDSSDLSAKVATDTLQGVYIAPSSDATGASGAWVRDYSGPVFGEWFGAVSGGSSVINTSAIQAALDSFPAVALGRGTFSHNGLQIKRDNQSLTGTFGATTLFLASGSDVPSVSNGKGSVAFNAHIYYLTIDGNGDNQSTASHGIATGNSLGWKIAYNHIKNTAGDGVRVEGSSSSELSLDSYIHHNRIENTGIHGVRVGNFAGTVETANNIIGPCGNSGVNITNVDTRTHHNHVFAAEEYGIHVALTSANAQINGNHVESCRKHGIRLAGAGNCTVTGNLCTKNSRVTSPGTFDGIALEDRSGAKCRDITIVGNRSWSEGVIDGGGLVQRYGLSIAEGSYDLTVTGNILSGNRDGGLKNFGAVSSFISNNSPYDIAGTVKYFDQVQDADLTKTVSISCTADNTSAKGVAGLYTLLVGVNNLANDDGLFGEFRVSLIKVSSGSFRYVIDKIAGDLTIGDLSIAFSTNTSSLCVLDVSVVGRKGINLQASQLDYNIDLFFSSTLSIA